MTKQTLSTEIDPRLWGEPIPVIRLTDGSVVQSWCSVCGCNTAHVYHPYDLCKLRCVRCEEAGR